MAPATIATRIIGPCTDRSGYSATPITRLATTIRQLWARIGTAVRWRAVRYQPIATIATSVRTVAQLAPKYPNGGISTRLSATFTTIDTSAAHVKVSWRSIAFSAPMNVLHTNMNGMPRARIWRAGTDSGYEERKRGGSARMNVPTASGRPRAGRA